MWRVGQVVVTEGNRDSWISKTIAWATGSWATHVFLVLDDQQAIEAKFPRVRVINTSARIAELEEQGRAYVVMEHPELKVSARWRLAEHAMGMVGRWYDLGQVLLYLVSGRFWRDGAGTLTCSRLVTAAFQNVGVSLFPDRLLDSRRAVFNGRLDNVRRGYATPVDLLLSSLVTVHFSASPEIRSVDDLLPPLDLTTMYAYATPEEDA